jgi:hypothetical protein
MTDYLPPPHGDYAVSPDDPLSIAYALAALMPLICFTALYNWTGQPAVSLPLAVDDDDDLPVGIQLAAQRLREVHLLDGIGAPADAATLPASRREADEGLALHLSRPDSPPVADDESWDRILLRRLRAVAADGRVPKRGPWSSCDAMTFSTAPATSTPSEPGSRPTATSLPPPSSSTCTRTPCATGCGR